MSVNVSGLKAGGSNWNSSFTMPSSLTDPETHSVADPVPGSNGRDIPQATITWSGCIEERQTDATTDYDPIPTDALDLNIDMVGRNRCDDPAEADSLFLIGSDRISTELHQISEAANRAQPRPMTLDFTMNSPADLEQLYTRSDHYSYAAKGIPVAFFTTGLHPDYHRVSDTADKINYPKMARIGQLMYQSGYSLAATDRVLERDNKGPQSGFGTKAEVIKK